ncbi:MAG: hypothetical protein H6Q58_2305 [Firmicutes bacterium]|nr:hypothetical protein [Bacillota bacterium]
MGDLELAKEILDRECLTLAIVKNGSIICTSAERGIKPLYTLVNSMREQLRGSSASDKAIGRAAALLYEYAEVKELHTKLISEKAVDILKRTPILYEFEKSVPYIKNRDKTGMCPVETLSCEIDNIGDLMAGISNFLENIRR